MSFGVAVTSVGFHSLPIGSKPTYIVAKIPRVECKSCGLIRQIQIGFTAPLKRYTHAIERYAVQLCRAMTIQDVAAMLGLSWDKVKEIELA
jgi:transposase